MEAYHGFTDGGYFSLPINGSLAHRPHYNSAVSKERISGGA
jgi:hypothetical protein